MQGHVVCVTIGFTMNVTVLRRRGSVRRTEHEGSYYSVVLSFLCVRFFRATRGKTAHQRSARPMLPQAKVRLCDAEQRNCVTHNCVTASPGGSLGRSPLGFAHLVRYARLRSKTTTGSTSAAKCRSSLPSSWIVVSSVVPQRGQIGTIAATVKGRSSTCAATAHMSGVVGARWIIQAPPAQVWFGQNHCSQFIVLSSFGTAGIESKSIVHLL